MLFIDRRLSSRIAAITWSIAFGSGLCLLLLDVIGEVRESLSYVSERDN